MLPQQLFNALVLGSVYALFSMGFTLTFGVLRVINLLYGFYVAAGAFLALVLVRDVGLPLWVAGVLAALGTGIIGMVCDTAVLMPLRHAKAPELASLIVTLGGVLLANSVMFLIFGAEVRRFPVDVLSQAPISEAASGFSDSARMAMPRRVRSINQNSAVTTIATTTMMTS